MRWESHSRVIHEWEEEDALEALSDALLRPNESEHAWLLLASSDRD